MMQILHSDGSTASILEVIVNTANAMVVNYEAGSLIVTHHPDGMYNDLDGFKAMSKFAQHMTL